jgi:hypothetical protein
MKKIMIGESLAFGRDSFTKYPWIYVAIGLIMGVLNAVGNINFGDIGNIIAGAVITILGIIMGIGDTKITLNAVDGKKPEVKTLFTEWRLSFKYLAATILFAIIFIIPLLIVILLILGFTEFTIDSLATTNPAILVTAIIAVIAVYLVVFMRYIFVFQIIIDQQTTVRKSFTLSSKITKGYRLRLFWFLFVSLLVNILGVIILFVGVLATRAITGIALSHMYRKLLHRHMPELAPAVAAEVQPHADAI